MWLVDVGFVLGFKSGGVSETCTHWHFGFLMAFGRRPKLSAVNAEADVFWVSVLQSLPSASKTDVSCKCKTSEEQRGNVH